jgi:hypothetical protein
VTFNLGGLISNAQAEGIRDNWSSPHSGLVGWAGGRS